jgi:hypothetical protein
MPSPIRPLPFVSRLAVVGLAVACSCPWLEAAEATVTSPVTEVPQVRSWEGEDFGWLTRKVAKLPEFKSEKPRFTWWALGTGKKSAALMVWDESGGNGSGHDLLYFDRDFDGDLTEEGERITAEPAEKHTFRGVGDAYIVKDVTEADGKAVFGFLFVRHPKGEDFWQTSFKFSMPNPANPAAKAGYDAGVLPGPVKIQWGESPETAPVYRLGTPAVVCVKGMPGSSIGTCAAGAELAVYPVGNIMGSGSGVYIRGGFNTWDSPVSLRVKAANGTAVEHIPFVGACVCGGGFERKAFIPRRVPPGEHELVCRVNRGDWEGGTVDFVFPVTVTNRDFGRDIADPALAALRAKFTGPLVRFASLRRAVTPRELQKVAADEPLVACRTADLHIMSSLKNAGFVNDPVIGVGQSAGLEAPNRGLVQFDLSGLPQGAKVLGAMVRLTLVNVPFATAGADARVDAYAVRREWANELGGRQGLHCSWYGPFYAGNKSTPEGPHIVFWKQGGCEDPQEDRYPDPAGSVSVAGFPAKPANEPAESHRMVSMDVTDTVRQWADGTLANHGLVLVYRQPEGTGWAPICSSDHPEYMFRPTLVVAYEGGPAKAALQPAAGEDLEAARAAAARRGVPLAVKFYSPMCAVSTKVNATTFQNPEVVKACADRVELVSLKVEEHPLVAQEMGVAAVPMLVVLAPDGSRKLASLPADDLRDPQAFRTRLAELAPQP